MPYYSFFESNNTLNDFFRDKFEFGYALLNYVFKSTFEYYTCLLVFIATVLIVIKIRASFLYTAYPLIALFIALSSTFDLFFVRQTLAIAICMFSVFFIIRKNFVCFFLVCLVAMSIHFSAIVFLPAYWLYHAKISKTIWVSVLAMLVIWAFFGDPSQMLSAFLEAYLETENIYVEKLSVYSAFEKEGGNYLVAVIRRALFLPFYILYLDRITEKNPYYKNFLNLVFFGYGLFIFFGAISEEISTRIAPYYTVYEFILISSFFSIAKKKSIKLLIFFILVFYFGIRFMTSIYNFYDEYVPYYGVWNYLF